MHYCTTFLEIHYMHNTILDILHNFMYKPLKAILVENQMSFDTEQAEEGWNKQFECNIETLSCFDFLQIWSIWIISGQENNWL